MENGSPIIRRKGVIPLDKEQDLVVFVDDGGDEITMEVLDYFFYEGQEYALLTEYDEECEECEEETCEHHHEDEEFEVIVMRVVPVEDDQEEFVPVEDELIDKLVEFVQNELYADEDFEDEDEDE